MTFLNFSGGEKEEKGGGGGDQRPERRDPLARGPTNPDHIVVVVDLKWSIIVDVLDDVWQLLRESGGVCSRVVEQ